MDEALSYQISSVCSGEVSGGNTYCVFERSISDGKAIAE